MFPRQPSPTGYHNTYQLYTMENTRQTILNDYITSQQMQVIPRPDMARGLSPREQPVAIPYPPPPRGKSLICHGRQGAVVCRLCACEVVATFCRRPEANDLFFPFLIQIDKFSRFALLNWGCDSFGCYSTYLSGVVIKISHLLSGCFLQVDHYSTPRSPVAH